MSSPRTWQGAAMVVSVRWATSASVFIGVRPQAKGAVYPYLRTSRLCVRRLPGARTHGGRTAAIDAEDGTTGDTVFSKQVNQAAAEVSSEATRAESDQDDKLGFPSPGEVPLRDPAVVQAYNFQRCRTMPEMADVVMRDYRHMEAPEVAAAIRQWMKLESRVRPRTHRKWHRQQLRHVLTEEEQTLRAMTLKRLASRFKDTLGSCSPETMAFAVADLGILGYRIDPGTWRQVNAHMQMSIRSGTFTEQALHRILRAGKILRQRISEQLLMELLQFVVAFAPTLKPKRLRSFLQLLIPQLEVSALADLDPVLQHIALNTREFHVEWLRDITKSLSMAGCTRDSCTRGQEQFLEAALGTSVHGLNLLLFEEGKDTEGGDAAPALPTSRASGGGEDTDEDEDVEDDDDDVDDVGDDGEEDEEEGGEEAEGKGNGQRERLVGYVGDAIGMLRDMAEMGLPAEAAAAELQVVLARVLREQPETMTVRDLVNLIVACNALPGADLPSLLPAVCTRANQLLSLVDDNLASLLLQWLDSAFRPLLWPEEQLLRNLLRYQGSVEGDAAAAAVAAAEGAVPAGFVLLPRPVPQFMLSVLDKAIIAPQQTGLPVRMKSIISQSAAKDAAVRLAGAVLPLSRQEQRLPSTRKWYSRDPDYRRGRTVMLAASVMVRVAAVAALFNTTLAEMVGERLEREFIDLFSRDREDGLRTALLSMHTRDIGVDAWRAACPEAAAAADALMQSGEAMSQEELQQQQFKQLLSHAAAAQSFRHLGDEPSGEGNDDKLEAFSQVGMEMSIGAGEDSGRRWGGGQQQGERAGWRIGLVLRRGDPWQAGGRGSSRQGWQDDGGDSPRQRRDGRRRRGDGRWSADATRDEERGRSRWRGDRGRRQDDGWWGPESRSDKGRSSAVQRIGERRRGGRSARQDDWWDAESMPNDGERRRGSRGGERQDDDWWRAAESQSVAAAGHSISSSSSSSQMTDGRRGQRGRRQDDDDWWAVEADAAEDAGIISQSSKQEDSASGGPGRSAISHGQDDSGASPVLDDGSRHEQDVEAILSALADRSMPSAEGSDEHSLKAAEARRPTGASGQESDTMVGVPLRDAAVGYTDGKASRPALDKQRGDAAAEVEGGEAEEPPQALPAGKKEEQAPDRGAEAVAAAQEELEVQSGPVDGEDMGAGAAKGEARNALETGPSEDWPAQLAVVDAPAAASSSPSGSEQTRDGDDAPSAATSSQRWEGRTAELQQMTLVKGLRPLAKEYGLKVGGVKAELVQRILEHEKALVG